MFQAEDGIRYLVRSRGLGDVYKRQDKNRTEYIRHWETIIDWGDEWKYKLGTSEPPASWKNLAFDDQLWTNGQSGFGYGDDDDSTIVPDNTNSVYIRKVFSIVDINEIKKAILHVDYDDAFVAYLNGVEIARANIGTVGIPPTYNQSATNYTEPLIIYGVKPCLLYTSPSPRDRTRSRMPSSA